MPIPLDPEGRSQGTDALGPNSADTGEPLVASGGGEAPDTLRGRTQALSPRSHHREGRASRSRFHVGGGLPTQATKSRLMKFPPVLITALPDQSTPSIQKATYSLKDTGAGEGASGAFTPPCSLLEQCWEAGERHAGGPSLRSVLTFIPAVQRPHSGQHRPSTAHTATVRRGVWRLACRRSSPTPAWAHADHPRLPHGQCWPGESSQGQ